MDANTLNLKELFQKDVRYVIPTFQRPYVWNQEDQWEPLWEDVRNTAERYLDELAAVPEEDDRREALAEEAASSHFLGAVVLQQLPTASTDIDTRHVIDGQQRMTTLQIILDAAQEVLEKLGFEVEARRLSRLVLNGFATGDDVFKLWPAQLDQDGFRAAMTNGASTDEHSDALIVQAHEFFQLQIKEWIEWGLDVEEQADRVRGLETALFGLLEMVVIDLGTADDAYVIFETLNARGTPLLASDLVKNLVLQTAAREGLSPDELYGSYWKPFEDRWWREDIRQGRLIRPRVDIFLNYWLVMRLADEVPSHQVFPKFRDLVKDSEDGIEDLVRELRDAGQTYRSFDAFDPFSKEGTFFYRWRTIDAGVTTPLLLWMFSRGDDALTPEARHRALATLESYLVRRMVCRMTTKDYNRIFVDVLDWLEKSEASADEALVRFLAEQDSESRVWPRDRQLSQAFADLPLYRLLTRGRMRMVLEAMEDAQRSPKSEEEHVLRGKLTIEHIMPQQWEKHWPLADASDAEEAAIDRQRLVHSIGNLTLVTKSLNPSMSNGPWPEKRSALDQHSVLHLNKDLLTTWGQSPFGDDQIRTRSASLASLAAQIWASPDAAVSASDESGE